jgi:competence protein ComEA
MDGKKQSLSWMLVMLVAGFIVGMGALSINGRAQPAPLLIQPPPPSPLPAATATPRPLRAYISGAVRNPDVYTLPPESIVRDLVQMAGGFSGEAAPEAVNLALPLADGMHVHIPSRDEASSAPPLITLPLAPAGASSTGASGSAGSLININTATLEELDTLPGIGPSTAQKIIDHRNSYGPFPTIEAILDVPGIGPVKFEQIKALITVG